MNIYLSGPMTGLPNLNHAAFNSVTAELREAGFRVYNPAETWPLERKFDKREGFAEYFGFICREGDAIVLLPGWRDSLGAKAEYMAALNVGVPVIEVSDFNGGGSPLMYHVINPQPLRDFLDCTKFERSKTLGLFTPRALYRHLLTLRDETESPLPSSSNSDYSL